MVRWLAVMASLLLYCGTALAADKVVLQLRWDHQFQFAGYYAAQWQGFYKEAGLDVEIRSAVRENRKIVNAVTEVSDGRADFGIGAADILVARDKGKPLVVLSSVFQRSPVSIITRRAANVMSPADLSTLTTDYVPGDLSAVEMRAMMMAEGIDITKLPSFKHLDRREQAYELFARGVIDAYPGFIWTSLWSAKEQGIDVSVLSPSAYGIDFYGDSLFTHQALAENNPELIQRFVEASMRGWEYALENQEQIADRITQDMDRKFPIKDIQGFNRFQAKEVLKLTLFPLINLGHINPERWRRMHETLRNFGILKGAFEEQDVIFDPERREQERWAQIKEWIVVGGALSVLLIGGVLMWNRSLSHQVEAATAKVLIAHDALEERVKERTEELNANKERLASTFDAIDEGVWDWNIKTKEVIFSANWPRIFGYTLEEVEPQVQTWLDLLHPDDMSTVMNRVEDHFEGRAPIYQSEHRMRHKDGQWLWVLDRGKVIERDEQGHPVRMVGADLDITKRKNAEETLRKLSRAVDQSPSAIFITDTDGVIEYINAKFTDMTGYRATDAIGGTPRLLKSNDTSSEVIEELWSTIKSGHEWRGEIQDQRKDGSHFWAYETIAPVKDESGKITHFVATHEDISKRKDAELAAQKAHREADLANRAKSELMANMSHELRTPLNAIIGFSDTIRDEVFGPVGHDKYREYVDDISSSGALLLDLISDILDVSAIEVGKLELNEEDIDVRALVSDTVRLLQHRADEGGVTLDVDVADGVPLLYVDARRMKQILLNLLSNAVKFTPQNGSVSLEVASDQDGQFVFVLTDTGIGMSKVDLEKAMTPFGQVSRNSDLHQEGTGLGLPLCKGLVELHGGTLTITSVKDQGTRAVVRMPASVPAAVG